MVNECYQDGHRARLQATTSIIGQWQWVAQPCTTFRIGVIYVGIRGVPVPHFLDWWIPYTPTFQDEKVKNLPSPAVNRGDLWRLNYNKTVFDTIPSQSRMRRGYLLPVLPTPRRDPTLVLLLNRYPHFLDQSYAPGISYRRMFDSRPGRRCVKP